MLMHAHAYWCALMHADCVLFPIVCSFYADSILFIDSSYPEQVTTAHTQSTLARKACSSQALAALARCIQRSRLPQSADGAEVPHTVSNAVLHQEPRATLHDTYAFTATLHSLQLAAYLFRCQAQETYQIEQRILPAKGSAQTSSEEDGYLIRGDLQ